ncbi:MAG TPA: hypothetical protein V6D16_16355 [Candidatus Obscuribacterales bacterium]
MFLLMAIAVDNWLQRSRHSSRGSTYLFAPMANFNVMAEVGETPP